MCWRESGNIGRKHGNWSASAEGEETIGDAIDNQLLELFSNFNPGSAEAPDFAREADGALDMTVAKAPHSQTRPQDSPRITEQAVGRATQHPVNRYS